MTLEERVQALEAALANQQNLVKDAANAAIRSALRPGGQLYALRADTTFSAAGGQLFIDGARINVGEAKAAQIQTAEEVVNEITEQIKSSKLFSQLS
ncbi:hypothetical protein AAAW43_003743 [Cronobacter sakazakii]|uniref:hypothetical protein n=1 Tax=Cronobacter sakazakii TaxID=28141 RepID=UPI00105616B4|nr:hypothetical protein [Cronobacter sakazakii]ELY2955831.1 hypothetical protein [Cronobacter sakazakii]ELZ3146591.1 hypothetical protein [Cronobacter sakazakii]EMA5529845.1 hypothetical protein [Cronobacter sakazakii]EMC4332179.1 hypothetical protein [Cronobacter sakazakii]EMD7613612.1 hypothetical protein [Cronobacter sakazakii]